MFLRHRVLDPIRPERVAPGLCALGIMTKVPRAGRVKTRLQPPLSADEAAALNICFLRDTAAAIDLAGTRGGNSVGVGVYTPIGEEAAYVAILPEGFLLIPQRCEDFGERLIAACDDLFACGFALVCLINSDSPTVLASSFHRAAELLRQPGERVVLGPSDDGGYYLIGLQRTRRELFQRIDWSTERVFKQTLDRAKEISLSVELLPACFDIDDGATLRRLCDELLSDGTNPTLAPATREFLSQLIAREGRDRVWPERA